MQTLDPHRRNLEGNDNMLRFQSMTFINCLILGRGISEQFSNFD